MIKLGVEGIGRVDVVISEEAEKRIRHIVYCAEQLMTKKVKLWATRYERACAAAKTVEELDEAILRIHKKYPRLKLDKLVQEMKGKSA